MSLIGAAWLLACVSATAHVSRPAYLQVQALPANHYQLSWKLPRGSGLERAPELAWPAQCRQTADWHSLSGPGGVTMTARYACADGGLAGQSLQLAAFPAELSEILVRVVLDGEQQLQVLRPGQSLIAIAATPSAWQVLRDYGLLGIEHILLGIDHLLFVLGLVLLVRGTGPLIATVTAFTLAHSLTLALAVLGVTRVPQAPVEAAIALSILFLAVELVHREQGRQGLAERLPWLVALSFGLLHGFGFAGALTSAGLPAAAVPLALFSFNIGVEAGQLLFIAAVLLLRAGLRRWWTLRPAWSARLLPYAIGSLAAFWTLERIAAF